MPEGPEIRRAADRIADAVSGEVLRDVFFAFASLKRWEKKLTDRRVREVATRGKALLIRFDGALNLYAHNQLYGRWYVTKRGSLPATKRQLRVGLHTDRSSALLYSASEIEIVADAKLDSHRYLARLGPDVLDPITTPASVRRAIEAPRVRRRSLGALLLDQGFLSGIGNYLRSEILFVAGLSASRRPAQLDANERRRLAKAALTISRRAYRSRGVTNDPAIVRALKARKRPRSEFRHFVFAREGLPCHRCSTPVRRTLAAGRRLYWCPGCQP